MRQVKAHDKECMVKEVATPAESLFQIQTQAIKQENPPDILLIEDHHEAYYAWRERRFKKMTLVHLDAHIDFGFQEVKEVPLILNEAKSLSELKSQLEKAVLFRRKKFELEKLTHIGNYIYPAMRDGIVTEFYWVIPGDIGEFRKCLGILKKLLRDLKKEDPYSPDAPPLIQSRRHKRPGSTEDPSISPSWRPFRA